MFSIDQNSHSLWDALPKLHALHAAGRGVRHVLEDIDVAFTALGAKVDEPNLHIAPEQFHAAGGQDWGAALFYNDFLGRLPVEIRRWEPMLGATIAAVARQLNQSPEELYRQYAVGDNRMLIGSSYLGDKEHHRIIGDLAVAQVAPFVRQIISLAEEDCLRCFPADESRRRTRDWFAAEKQRVERLLDACAEKPLPELYCLWMSEHLPAGGASMDQAGRLFALGGSPDRDAMLKLFLRDYDLAAGLYNQAVRETDVGVHELDVKHGEAPFFAFGLWQNHRARCELRIQNGAMVLAGETFAAPEGRIPVEALRKAGVTGLAGKAVVLALQVRLPPGGAPLALPHGGSVYMPACHRFVALLREHNLLPAESAPVVRVRFRLLDRLRRLQTPICLPAHLTDAFGREEIPARVLGENWAGVAAEAKQRLADFRDPARRAAWQEAALPKQMQALAELQREKRRQAEENPKNPRSRELWKQIKEVQNDILAQTLGRVSLDWQAAQLEFYDSRGAILPWSAALGGEAFYHDVIGRAEIREETT
ncbi:MAG: hypothetical protein JW849_08445 [Phycisphaerae bacterium]|nr:hypothetical protein [Phycisphaerae bacterium]